LRSILFTYHIQNVFDQQIEAAHAEAARIAAKALQL
jgi:hypothetical protein